MDLKCTKARFHIDGLLKIMGRPASPLWRYRAANSSYILRGVKVSLRTNHPSDRLVMILPFSHGLDLRCKGQIFCSCPGRHREELIFNLRQPRIIYLSKHFQCKSVYLACWVWDCLLFCKGKKEQPHCRNLGVKREERLYFEPLFSFTKNKHLLTFERMSP